VAAADEDEDWPDWPPEPTAPLVIVDIGPLCFGLVADADTGIVTEAPPVARWQIGRTLDYVVSYWRRRGASVMSPPPPTIRPGRDGRWGGRDVVDVALPEDPEG
jgi:hypothetical protein